MCARAIMECFRMNINYTTILRFYLIEKTLFCDGLSHRIHEKYIKDRDRNRPKLMSQWDMKTFTRHFVIKQMRKTMFCFNISCTFLDNTQC